MFGKKPKEELTTEELEHNTAVHWMTLDSANFKHEPEDPPPSYVRAVLATGCYNPYTQRGPSEAERKDAAQRVKNSQPTPDAILWALADRAERGKAITESETTVKHCPHPTELNF